MIYRYDSSYFIDDDHNEDVFYIWGRGWDSDMEAPRIQENGFHGTEYCNGFVDLRLI